MPPTRPTSSPWLNWPPLSCTRSNNRHGSNDSRPSRPTCASCWRGRSSEGDVDGALRVAVALWRFWQRRGYWEEGRSWLVRLLTHATAVDAVEPATWAAALTGAVWLAHYQNDFAAVRTFLQEGLERYRRLGRADGLVEVLQGQALVAQSLGENRRAADAVRGGARPVPHARRSRQNRRVPLSPQLGDARVGRLRPGDRPRRGSTRPPPGGGASRQGPRAVGPRRRRAGSGGTGRRTRPMRREPGHLPGVGRATGRGILLAQPGASRPTKRGILTSHAPLAEESLAIFRRLDVGRALAEVLASWGPSWTPRGIMLPRYAALTEALRLAVASRTAMGGCGSPGGPGQGGGRSTTGSRGS